MRVAMVSPFPPKITGIADYSCTLAGVLGGLMDLSLFDFGADSVLPSGQKARGAGSVGALIKLLAPFDGVVYHVGNNPHYHRQIALAMSERPGLAVIHDSVLYYLAAGMGQGGLAKALAMESGLAGFRKAQEIRGASPGGNILHYPNASEHPCLAWLADGVTAAIVHNEYSARQLRAARFTVPVEVVPMLGNGPERRLDEAGRSKLRQELGVAPGELLIGSFGFIAPTKRLDRLFEALSALRGQFAFRILIVGIGDDLSASLARSGLTERAIRLGYVPDGRFLDYMQAVDVLANLRYPTMGESSAPLGKALALGIPALVTDQGPCSELPDGVVMKIPLGKAEIPRLRESLALLLSSTETRESYRVRAEAYARQCLSPGVVAQRYAAVIAKYIRAEEKSPDVPAEALPLRDYVTNRLRGAFP